jgi:hypothetical protein
MKKFYTLILFFTCSLPIYSQVAIEWQKSFGGPGWDVAHIIEQTSDGGFIVAGESTANGNDVTGNHGTYDYWVVKLDSTGNMQWQKSLGGTGADYAYSAVQTGDGGYIIAGRSNSSDGDVTGSHGNYDYWIVKLDVSGNIQWQKSLGGSSWDEAHAIQQTTDGGYIVAGFSDSDDGDVTGVHGFFFDYWIVKLDNAGNIQWQKAFGGSDDDEAYAIQQTADGGYIVAGYTLSNDGDVTGHHGDYDYWVVKLDSAGNMQWQKCLGGSSEDIATSVQQTTDGGYVVAGYSNSVDGDITNNYGSWDYWIVKLDGSGNIQWQKSLGGTNYDSGSFIRQTVDGGYIVAGGTSSNDGVVSVNYGDFDYWIVKLDSAGNLMWEKSLGGSGEEFAYSVQQTADRDFVAAGYTNSQNGDITVSYGSYDFWVVKLSEPTAVSSVDVDYNFSVYPNPVNDVLTINSAKEIGKVKIYDVVGKLIYHELIKNSNVDIEVKELDAGIYFLEAENYRGKFVKQ